MYKMSISQNNTVLTIPVLPEEIEIKMSVDNKTYSILQFGEIIRPGDRQLKQFSIKSYFPASDAPGGYIRDIENMISAKLPVRLILNRIDSGKILFDLNIQAVIDSFSYKESGGEPGDLEYTLQFTEYREYTAKVVS